jgi:hypothetical protein
MAGSASTLQDLSSFLEELNAEEASLKAEIEDRVAALMRRLAALVALRKAVEATIQGFTARSGAAAQQELPAEHDKTEAAPEAHKCAPKPMGEWEQLLRGMTQRAAIHRIAHESGGVIRVTEAGHILVAAGLVKGKARYAASHVYHIVSASPHYHRIAPGTFRLVPAEAPADAPSVAGMCVGGAEHDA